MRCASEVLLPAKNPNWPFESIFCSIANLVILWLRIARKKLPKHDTREIALYLSASSLEPSLCNWDITDILHLFIIIGFWSIELKSNLIISGFTLYKHNNISLEMLSQPGDFPFLRMYVASCISSSHIGKSSGPCSAVLCGNVHLRY